MKHTLHKMNFVIYLWFVCFRMLVVLYLLNLHQMQEKLGLISLHWHYKGQTWFEKNPFRKWRTIYLILKLIIMFLVEKIGTNKWNIFIVYFIKIISTINQSKFKDCTNSYKEINDISNIRYLVSLTQIPWF